MLIGRLCILRIISIRSLYATLVPYIWGQAITNKYLVRPGGGIIVKQSNDLIF